MAADCPYCEGKQVYYIANTNIEIPCQYCFKGIIPKTPEDFARMIRPGLLIRIKGFFRPPVDEPLEPRR